MRKVKHFAGYGTVAMGKIDDGTARLHVRVEGNHEWGLQVDESDLHTLYTWIVSRFRKDLTFEEWYRLRPLVSVVPNWRTDPAAGMIDTCDYYFYF